MKVAGIQMVSATSLQANLDAARALLEAAAQAGAELAVLPEYFCLLGRRDTDKLALREPFAPVGATQPGPSDNAPIQQFLAKAARELGLWIVGGTIPLEAGDEGHVRNTSLAYSPAGVCVARYDKIHLFRFDNGSERFDEARTIERGDTPVLFDLPSRDGHTWRIGMSVCYDLRFPELYRSLVASGAQLLLVPSAFTYSTGLAHWEVLLRARAIESLAFVLAPAQGGVHENGRRTWGHTLLADPWGVVLQQKAEGEGLVVGDIDIARLTQCRAQLPALDHRVM
ncbi:MAG: carbon-nitrogen hydrolase family protein [Bdellovibrionales bacterium]|nr:carbon-nitrogen hydrolase family protein [Ramlibacter sp.]